MKQKQLQNLLKKVYMKMNKNNIKYTQEQAVASWVKYLNTIRFENLMNSLNEQDVNLDKAITSLDNTLNEINKLIESDRGGEKGIHGFIAEISEVGIGNAKENIIGKNNVYEWVNDNGVADLVRNGTSIQQKYYQKDLSLNAIAEHLKKYPNFLKEGGKYQIPKDQYEKLQYLRSIPENEANKLATNDGTFSLKQWRKVNDFFKEGSIDINSIEPANLEYSEVQKKVVNSTINKEKAKIKEKDNEIRNKIINENKPTLSEGIKVTAISSIVEGGTTFVSLIIKKKKEKKFIKNFTLEDWQQIIKESGVSTAKGGVRGASLYILTNYVKTPSAVANALATSAFGVAEQVYLYKKGRITENELLENSELLYIDTSVSVISSILGQTIIPVPVIGAIIGNIIGLKMYEVAKDNFKAKEQEIIQKYYDEIKSLEKDLLDEYNIFIEKVKQEIYLYIQILEKLYSTNVQEVFEGSIKMAELYGIPRDEILDSKEKIDDYFNN